jgi:hypothetical protein
MRFLRKWLSLRYRLRARRWRARALAAESERDTLKLQLAAERYRNMAREDTFASAAVLGSRGMWGVAPRSGPALGEQQRQPAPTPDPYNLSGADLMEFETFWKPDMPAGMTELEAKRQFVRDVVVPRRMPLNDDPYGAH